MGKRKDWKTAVGEEAGAKVESGYAVEESDSDERRVGGEHLTSRLNSFKLHESELINNQLCTPLKNGPNTKLQRSSK